MKKHSEGYVLVYVLIVVVILSLLALGVCSIALRNLQSQQASVEQMQERYEAEGSMERFVAKLQAFREEDTTEYDSERAAISAAKDSFWSGVRNMANGIVTIQESSLTWEGTSCKITAQASAGDQTLTAELDIEVTIPIEAYPHSTDDGEGNSIVTYTYTYAISNVAFAYDTYDIATGGTAEYEGGGAA